MRIFSVVAAAAFAVALVGGGAAAKSPVAGPSAYGELGGGMLTTPFLPGQTLGVVSAAGLANLPLGDMLNFEAEGRGTSASGGSDAYSTYSDWGAYAHLYWRDPQRFAFGIFGGGSDLTARSITHGALVLGGGEAQAYLGNFTLYAQGAAFQSTAKSGWLYFNGWLARGTVRFFATPNFKLQFDGQWAAINAALNTTALTLIGSAEYRFSGTPWSVFSSVRWDQLAVQGGLQGTNTTVLVGVRGYFGAGGTLLDNDRNGPPMNVLPFPASVDLNFG